MMASICQNKNFLTALKILFISSLAIYALKTYAADSTSLVPQVPASASLASSCGLIGGVALATTGCKVALSGGGTIDDLNTSATNPRLTSFPLGGSAPYIAPYSGTYLVIVNLTLVSMEANPNFPIYYWIDGWASTVDYGSNITELPIRTFYSGDYPSQLDLNLTVTKTAYYSGTVYLTAGSGIYGPRAWAVCKYGYTCGSFSFQATPGGSAGCSKNSGGSCMYIYLLQ